MYMILRYFCSPLILTTYHHKIHLIVALPPPSCFSMSINIFHNVFISEMATAVTICNIYKLFSIKEFHKNQFIEYTADYNSLQPFYKAFSAMLFLNNAASENK
jgi:hypothetical protein